MTFTVTFLDSERAEVGGTHKMDARDRVGAIREASDMGPPAGATAFSIRENGEEVARLDIYPSHRPLAT